MRTITLTTPFLYWWHGYEPRTYGPGTVEVDEEVAASAEQAGFVEKEKAKTAQKDETK